MLADSSLGVLLIELGDGPFIEEGVVNKAALSFYSCVLPLALPLTHYVHLGKSYHLSASISPSQKCKKEHLSQRGVMRICMAFWRQINCQVLLFTQVLAS